MSTTKKTPKEKAGEVKKEEPAMNRSEANERQKNEKQAGKSRRVNYVVKDLPIY
ncbi:MAG TPA: hypothetical protein VK628_00820 [Flavitalea sp.]|nr:hypothetical protein [Flavitalea sp.]